MVSFVKQKLHKLLGNSCTSAPPSTLIYCYTHLRLKYFVTLSYMFYNVSFFAGLILFLDCKYASILNIWYKAVLIRVEYFDLLIIPSNKTSLQNQGHFWYQLVLPFRLCKIKVCIILSHVRWEYWWVKISFFCCIYFRASVKNDNLTGQFCGQVKLHFHQNFTSWEHKI